MVEEQVDGVVTAIDLEAVLAAQEGEPFDACAAKCVE